VVGVLTSVVTALVTTVERQIPTEVALDESDGMPRRCVVNLDNVTSQSTMFLTDRITRLDPVRMAQVCQALAHATGC
jgi:mRNA interferase MazF